MKLRTKNYVRRQKALRKMFRFTDLKSLLVAGFHASRSVVVKKDIIEMLSDLHRPEIAYAKAS